MVHGTATIVSVGSTAPVVASQPASLLKKEETTAAKKQETSKVKPISSPIKTIATSDIQQLKRRSALSISNLTSAKDKNTSSNTTKEIKNRPFTINELSMLWSAYAQKAQKNGNIGLFTALSGADIHLEDKNVINITTSSVVVSAEIENHILDILEYLKRELQNGTITHQITISDIQKEHIPYTPGEKYEYMVQKNKKIADLRTILGLNIDF